MYRQQDYGCGFVYVQVGRGVHDGLRVVSLNPPMAVLCWLTDVWVMALGELIVMFRSLDILARHLQGISILSLNARSQLTEAENGSSDEHVSTLSLSNMSSVKSDMMLHLRYDSNE